MSDMPPIVPDQDPIRMSPGDMRTAFDWFNRTLFNGRLPHCSLEPAIFNQARTTEAILLRLVHEMVRLEQAHVGKPGDRREWMALMHAKGLHAGEPGVVLVPGGPFERSCAALLETGFPFTTRMEARGDDQG